MSRIVSQSAAGPTKPVGPAPSPSQEPLSLQRWDQNPPLSLRPRPGNPHALRRAGNCEAWTPKLALVWGPPAPGGLQETGFSSCP